MRQFIIAAFIAVGLVALWAIILPLTAQPAPASPAMTKALFLCRGQNGINRDCARALAKALTLDEPDQGITRVSDRTCPVSRRTLAGLEHHN